MTAAAFPRTSQGQAGMAMPGGISDRQVPCIVTLIDRRTGLAHRVNGSPLALFTLHPDLAAADLLAGRDTKVWDARVDPIGIGASA